MYKVYDVSMAIYEGMAVYKNKPEKQPQVRVVQDFGPETTVRESRLDMDVHCGTHVDSPLHMVEHGGTMETIPLDRLVGPCRVLDLTHVSGGISRADLQAKHVEPGELLVFKTKNSLGEAFDPEFVFLSEDGAKHLVEVGVKAVAIDALGIERSQPGHPTHRTLFAADIVIIEGLRLKDVPEGKYFFVGAPIKLLETEAAPARVVLIEGLL